MPVCSSDYAIREVLQGKRRKGSFAKGKLIYVGLDVRKREWVVTVLVRVKSFLGGCIHSVQDSLSFRNTSHYQGLRSFIAF